MKYFPIQGGPAIPWSMLEPHVEQIKYNHDQTLECLAERGGLSPYEAVCAIEGLKLFRNKHLPDPSHNPMFFLERLRRYIKMDRTAEINRLRSENKQLKAELEKLQGACRCPPGQVCICP